MAVIKTPLIRTREETRNVTAHRSAPKSAVLMVNLGTPDAPTPAALRRYLRQFLSDPRVIEVPKADLVVHSQRHHPAVSRAEIGPGLCVCLDR